MKPTFGFTLIELLVTMAVAAVIVTWAVPNFRTMITNNRVSSQANSLLVAVNTARSAAVSRGTPVTVCASTDGKTCSQSANWATGWIVFTDGDSGTPGVVDGSDQIIRVWPALAGKSALTGSEIDGTQSVVSTLTYMRYLPSGLLDNAPASGDQYRLYLEPPKPCRGNQARNIDINPVGRPAAAAASCT
ncbi:MAG: GspH/FimT family pseudopilin [Gammaproteobacteria bacterium]